MRARFAEVARAHPRAFWLDGGPRPGWDAPCLGWLEPEDVSLVYDSTSRRVWRLSGASYEPVGEDVFEVLAAEMADDAARGETEARWIGYFGYACRSDLAARTGATGVPVPDAVWMRASHLEVVEDDSPSNPRASVASAGGNPTPRGGRWYAEAFERVQEELRAGNTYEVNLTYRERLVSDLDPVSAYLRLRELNPAPYSCYLQHDVPGGLLRGRVQGAPGPPGPPRGRVHVLGSSPESFADLAPDGWIQTRPIKGTTPRGSSPEEDRDLAAHLATAPKFRAENLMVTDLLRNDVSMVARPGTVTVPQLMQVESYPSVHQLVSTVRGRLRPGVGPVDAVRAMFPPGSMTGAPKERTMSVIADVEDSARGVYAGAIGQFAGDGRAELAVVIRTLVTTGDGAWELGTGGGITVRSDPAEEWAESRWKAERLLSVFADAPAAVRR